MKGRGWAGKLVRRGSGPCEFVTGVFDQMAILEGSASDWIDDGVCEVLKWLVVVRKRHWG